MAYDVEHLRELQDPSNDTNYGYSYYDDTDPDTMSVVVALEEALLAFVSILLLLHFVLFVRACVETHQYNSSRVTRTVYVQVPVQMVGGAPGQQPIGYYAYQPLPGQPLPFMPPPQPQPQVSGSAPVAAPQQAHLYGYYAPAPSVVPQQGRDYQAKRTSVPGSSNAAAGRSGHSPAPVSPASSSAEPSVRT